ncbi:MAG: hypothetical protein ACW99G_00365 [Candidatus Thorarchaeota archaeon]|jgi:hypothetical protein
MKTFTNYLQLRENSALDIGKSVIQNTSLSNTQEESLSALYRLADHMWEKHRQPFLTWLNMYKGDEVVDKLLKQIQSDPNQLTQATHRTPGEEPEEIVPSSADTSMGDSDE